MAASIWTIEAVSRPAKSPARGLCPHCHLDANGRSSSALNRSTKPCLGACIAASMWTPCGYMRPRARMHQLRKLLKHLVPK
jgi:hypothetical protein